MPVPQTSNSISKGLFSNRDFKYVEADDEYECPAGERLEWHTRSHEGGMVVDKYWTSACTTCPWKSNCTSETNDYRRISRMESEELTEHMLMRLETEPDRMKIRRSTVEHPFGTIKYWMGHTHFQLKGLENVATEMSLHVLAYNMNRCINLLGLDALLEAIRELVCLQASLVIVFRGFVVALWSLSGKIPQATSAIGKIYRVPSDRCAFF